MEKNTFLGTLRALLTAVVLGVAVKGARLRFNSNKGDQTLDQSALENGTALGNIMGAYSPQAWNAIIGKLAVYLGLATLDATTGKLTAVAPFTNADFKNPNSFSLALEANWSDKIAEFVKTHGAGFTNAVRPASLSASADRIVATLNARGVIGNPLVNGITVYQRIGVGDTNGKGAVREMLQAIGITTGIDTVGIDSLEPAAVDLTGATNFNGATVKAVANPFDDNAVEPAKAEPAPEKEAVIDPTAKVRAQVAAYFSARNADKAPAMRQAILDEGIELPEDVKTVRQLTDYVVANADSFELPVVD